MIARFRFSRPMIARFETLLPEPDSPTIPSVSPRWSVNETSLTACTTPSIVGKRTVRFTNVEERLAACCS